LLRKIAVDRRAVTTCVAHDEMIDRFDHIFRLRDGRLEPETTVGAGWQYMTVG
jgi:putative ABC transport system ATP-binding protein